MYQLYINEIPFPITPSKITLKTKNQNKTYTLANGNEVNIKKPRGLKELDFELLLPNDEYPFASYPDGFKNSDYYKAQLDKLKKDKKTFAFILVRNRAMNTSIQKYQSLSMNCTIEDLEFTEQASDGFDMRAKVKLKEWSNAGTVVKKVKSKKKKKSKRASKLDKLKKVKYKIKKGDTLSKISKMWFDTTSKAKKIYKDNKKVIKNPKKLPVGKTIYVKK